MPKPARRNGSVLFTDIVNSTPLQRELGDDEYRKISDQFHTLVAEVTKGQEGLVVSEAGDGVAMLFDFAEDAVKASLAIMLRLVAPDVSTARIRVRIGVAQGEVQESPITAVGSSRFVGLPFNMAARLQNLAHPGQILVTRHVDDLCRHNVKTFQGHQVEWMRHGAYSLKGLDQHEICEVGISGLSPLRPPERALENGVKVDESLVLVAQKLTHDLVRDTAARLVAEVFQECELLTRTYFLKGEISRESASKNLHLHYNELAKILQEQTHFLSAPAISELETFLKIIRSARFDFGFIEDPNTSGDIRRKSFEEAREKVCTQAAESKARLAEIFRQGIHGLRTGSAPARAAASASSRLSAHRSQILSLAVSPNGSLAATGGDDKTIQIWNLLEGFSTGGVVAHQASIGCLAFSLDGNALVSGGDDERVKIWNVNPIRLLREISTHEDCVLAVALSKNIGASADESGKLLIWNRHKGSILHQIQAHRGEIWALSFSGDGQALLSAGTDQVGLVWNINSGRTLAEYHGHSQPIYAGTLSGDGRAFSGDFGGNLHVWEMGTGRQLAQIAAHRHRIWDVSFHPGLNLIATASQDGTLRLWTSDLQLVETFVGDDAFKRVRFTTDGSCLLGGCVDALLYVFRIEKR